MSHTKEPWSLGDIDVFGADIECSEGGLVARAEIEEDARRIVACVNACQFVTDEMFAGGWTARGHSNYCKRITNERDELLKVAQGILAEDMLQYLPAEYVANVRAAIASAKGGS